MPKKKPPRIYALGVHDVHALEDIAAPADVAAGSDFARTGQVVLGGPRAGFSVIAQVGGKQAWVRLFYSDMDWGCECRQLTTPCAHVLAALYTRLPETLPPSSAAPQTGAPAPAAPTAGASTAGASRAGSPTAVASTAVASTAVPPSTPAASAVRQELVDVLAGGYSAYERLYIWATQNHVVGALSQQLSTVLPRGALALSPYSNVHNTLATSFPDARRREERERVIDWMVRIVEQKRASLAERSARLAAIPAPPEEELQHAWRLLLEATLRAEAGTSPLAASVPEHLAAVDLAIETLPLRVVARHRLCVACTPNAVSLALTVDSPLALTLCSGSPYSPATCPNRLATLEATLQCLRGDSTHPARAALVAAVRTPVWRRALERMVPSSDMTYVLVATTEGPRVQRLHVATATPKKRGSGFVLKKAAHIPPEAPSSAHRWSRQLTAAALVADTGEAIIGELLAAEVGTDHVFVAGVDQPVPVVNEPVVVTTRRAKVPEDPSVEAGRTFGHGLAVSFAGETLALRDVARALNGGTQLIRFAEGRLLVGEVPAAARAFAVDPNLSGLVVPREGASALVRKLVAAGMPLELPKQLSGKALPATSTPVLRLTWQRPTLTVHLGVHVHADYPVLTPGEEPAVLYVDEAGEVAHVPRDLEGEWRVAEAIADRLGIDVEALAAGAALGLDQLAPMLASVKALGEDGSARLEWSTVAPRVAVARPDQVKVAVSASGRDWFGVSGTLDVAGGVPLALVLQAIRDRQTYVDLGNDHLLLLGEQLTEALAPLAGVVQPPARKGGDWRVGRVGAAALAAEASQVTFVAPETWLKLADRVQEAARLEPSVPTELQAELRHYQADGFRWLARLQHWAPGAALCDDMGLGKTVQAIALLLLRRDSGPALVVAPTSVGFNWARELERFAPSLAVRAFRGVASLDTLNGLKAGTVVVTSYDLVAGHLERFTAIEWGTLVLDEAQAVKNASTQRARAAAALKAEFRLALTGTPIENRAEELWSLFNVAVPGLLGSYESFRTRFGAAGGEQGKRQAWLLSRIVRPFILRRLKREVAQELPARTDISVEVTLSDDERRLYDRIRRAAADALVSASGPQNQLRFQVLTALTRLRQAACHPRLLDNASTVPSSKLASLMELVEGLREEGHRALVFSQFTTHLALVREALDAAGVPYRYLDGSTPAAQRRAEVDAFQEGLGDVFLLSLKAGGTGLNLTGADYVIHLDPWWNPAVEDQATDRAHRIGQTRPVTVYRLVAKDTLEERILALHADKRELVAAVLGGTNEATTLSTDELLSLLDEAS